MSKILTSSDRFLMSGGRWLTREGYVPPEPPAPETRYVNLNQSTGGTISASPMSGHDGDTVTLSNTPSTNYTFNGYTVNGASLYDGNKFDFNGSDVTCSASWTHHGRGPMPTQGLLYLTDFYGVLSKYVSPVVKYRYYDDYRYSAIPYHTSTDSYSDRRNINYGDSNPSLGKGTFGSGTLGMPESYAGHHFGSVSVDTHITTSWLFPYEESSKNVQREYSTAFWACCAPSTPSTGCNYVVTNGLEFEKWNQNAPWRIKYFVANDCTLVSGQYGTFTDAGEYRSSIYSGYVIVTDLDLTKMHHFNTYLNTMDKGTGKAYYEIYLDGKLLLRVRGDWDKIIHSWNTNSGNYLDPFPITHTFGDGLIVSEYCLYEGRVIHYPDEPIAL